MALPFDAAVILPYLSIVILLFVYDVLDPDNAVKSTVPVPPDTDAVNVDEVRLVIPDPPLPFDAAVTLPY